MRPFAKCEGSIAGIVLCGVLMCLPAGARANPAPWLFTENRGQAPEEIAFVASLAGGRFLISRDGALTLEIAGKANVGAAATQSHVAPITVVERAVAPPGSRRLRGDAAPTRVHYLIGRDRAGWLPKLRTFRSVTAPSLWPRIDLRLVPRARGIEKQFLIAPGGDPADIRLEVSGVQRLEALQDGRIALHTPHGHLHLSRPIAFQKVDGEVRSVAVAYQVDGQRYGFEVGAYDRSIPLVIDPLIEATYLGGGANDYINAIAVDEVSGDVYVAGSTTSIINGGPLSIRQGEDAFVARLRADLTTLLDLAYVGGNGTDRIQAVALLAPSTGGPGILVGGTTSSTDLSGVDGESEQGQLQGSEDGFFAVLPADLARIERATYFGDDNLCPGASFLLTDVAALVVDDDAGTSGLVYATGSTSAINLPGTGAGEQTICGGGTDGYVTALTPDLTDATVTSFIGGSGEDRGRGILLDIGQVFVAGTTTSLDLPGITAASAQPFLGDGDVVADATDAFVARFSADLADLSRATYFGGIGSEDLTGFVATGSSVYLTGNTDSPMLPATDGARQEESNDIYLTRLFNRLETGDLSMTTFLGGSERDTVQALAVETGGDRLLVAGATRSVDFPGTPGGAQEALSGSEDGFVLRIGTGLRPSSDFQATYLGGPDGPEETATALAVSEFFEGSRVYAAGITTSSDFPEVSGSAQPFRSGGLDDYLEGFIAMYDATLTSAADLVVDRTSVDFGEQAVGGTAEEFVEVRNAGTGPLTITDITFQQVGDIFTLSTEFVLGYCPELPITLAPDETCFLPLEFTPAAADDYSASVRLASNDLADPVTTILLAGIGTEGPEIRIDGMAISDIETYDFGLTNAGESNFTLITISNIGNAPLSVEEIRLTDPSEPTVFFLERDSCPLDAPFIVEATRFCSFRAIFRPTDASISRGEIAITSNDADEEVVTVTLTGRGNDVSGSCFIATAAYGSNMHEDVLLLRQFRDRRLKTNIVGRKLVAAYYALSPPIAELIASSEVLRAIMRALLVPLIVAVKYPPAVAGGLVLMLALTLLSIYRVRRATSSAA